MRGYPAGGLSHSVGAQCVLDLTTGFQEFLTNNTQVLKSSRQGNPMAAAVTMTEWDAYDRRGCARIVVVLMAHAL